MQSIDNPDIKTIAEFECDQADLIQRQRIFEDVIIQRIKVIQEFVRRQAAKSKLDNHNLIGSDTQFPRNTLQTLDYEGKIEEVVKWRMEAFQRKINERINESEQKTGTL